MNASLQVSATCSKDFSHSAGGTPCRILTDASALGHLVCLERKRGTVQEEHHNHGQ